MSEIDENGNYVGDEDEQREARKARRREVWCKCGYPDWPGHCPGWRNCPIHSADLEETESADSDS